MNILLTFFRANLLSGLKPATHFAAVLIAVFLLAACGGGGSSSGSSGGSTSTRTCECNGVSVSCADFDAGTGSCSTGGGSGGGGGISFRCSSGVTSCRGLASSCSEAQSICSCSAGATLQCTTTSSVATATLDIINNLTAGFESSDAHSIYLTHYPANKRGSVFLYDEEGEILEGQTYPINSSSTNSFSFFNEKIRSNSTK